MNDKMAIFIFSVNVINRLLLSFLVLTKVITLSGVHCVAASIAFSIRHKFEPDFPCLSHSFMFALFQCSLI